MWFGFLDEPLVFLASEITDIEMPIQFVPYNQPLENGDTIIFLGEEFDCGRIVGNRQVAEGETISLQFLITDGEEHRIQWWAILPNDEESMIYEGLTLSTVMSTPILYLYLVIDPE